MKMKNNKLYKRQGSMQRVAVKLILVGILALFLIGIVSATQTNTTENLSVTSWTTTGDTAEYGYQFTMGSYNMNITAVLKPSENTYTTWFLKYAGNGTTLQTGTFSTDWGDIPSTTLLAGGAYNITVYDGGASRTLAYKNGASNPIAGTNVTWDRAFGCSATQYCAIQAINLSYSSIPPAPVVTLTSPANATTSLDTTNYFVASITNSSSAVKNVSLYINGTINQTNTSQFNGTYNFSVALPYGFWNWTIDAYDTANARATTSTRDITIATAGFMTNTYTAFALESTTQIFYTNFTYASGVSISSVNITYNQTNYTATTAAINSTAYNVTASILLPSVTSNINKTFNWTIFFTDGTSLTSSNYQQQIQNFGLDNCSSNTIMILNFTMFDEDTSANLSSTGVNTTIKIDLSLYPNVSKTTPLITFSQLYTKTNPARVCVSNALGSSIFYMDTQVQYEANTYAREYYNIQNYSLNATSNPSQNITLYDLATNNSQNFTITYKDSSFLPVSNALIQVQRRYVDEGVFKVVEIPITSSLGQATASLVTNNVIYSFTVTKNGQVLATFANVYAICQNPSIQDCDINLNSFSSSIPAANFSASSDFAYTLTYNNNTRTVSSTFTIPSGAVGLVYLNVTKEDALGTSVCNQSVSSSSGTLSCVIGATLGNGTVIAKLYKNNVLVGQGQVKIDAEPYDIYGGVLVALGLFVMLTLIGAGLSDNPVFTIIFFIVGVIMLFALNLVANNGFIGYTATILWLIVAVVIVIVKAGGRS